MDTLQGNLDKVVQHGKRADAIVKNMLLHSREGSGEHRPVDINALVEEEPQPRLSRGAGREAGLQYHAGDGPLIRLPAKPTSSRRTSHGFCST